jgi:hypothetical protein
MYPQSKSIVSKNCVRDDNYDDEVNEGDEEPNASQSQPMMISFTEPVNLRKKPRKN